LANQLTNTCGTGLIFAQNKLCGELLSQNFQFSEFLGFTWQWSDYSSLKSSLNEKENIKTVVFLFDESLLSFDMFRQDIAQIPKEAIYFIFTKTDLIDENWMAGIMRLPNAKIIDKIPPLTEMKEYLLSELTDVQENQESNQDNLSTRETEILKLIGAGLTNKEIAKRLYISFYTVETHRKNIVRKLNVRHGELVRYAVKVSNGFS